MLHILTTDHLGQFSRFCRKYARQIPKSHLCVRFLQV